MTDRCPTRRRFLAGVGSTLAAASLPGCPASDADPCLDPTGEGCAAGGTATGLRGNHLEAMEQAHRLRLGASFDPEAEEVTDDGETFDLLVIGAGFSGLSAAIAYLDGHPDARIPILDNHDEFGGHARRNTFEVDGTTLIAGGGTYELESHEWGSAASRALLERIGLEPTQLAGYWDSSLLRDLDLTAGFFSDELSHGVEPSWAREMYAISWQEFFEQTNLDTETRIDLTALCASAIGPPGLTAGQLDDRSYEDYIEGDLGLSGEATRFADVFAKDLFGVGADQLVASAMTDGGPGLTWAGSDWRPGPARRYTEMKGPRYPDGMHTVLRGLLAELIPAAFTCPGSLDGLFLSDVCEHAFESGPVRLRLQATALAVQHEGDPATAERVEVVYVRDGAARRVHARQLIMAGGSFVARRILTDMPADNLAGAQRQVHCPMVYASVALRQWAPIAVAGVYQGLFLGSIYQVFMLQHPIYPPGWDAPYDPSQPITVMLTGGAIGQGEDVQAQAVAGRTQLEAMSLEDHEEEVASTLERLFGAYGFDRSHIAAITVNQFGHGYGFFDATTPIDVFEEARRAWGRISIAHTDSEGGVWAHAAIDAGLRAAQERLDHDS
jgi:spermidine dehydrogenase